MEALRASPSRWEFVVSASAPTDERKALAAEILREYGGHFINFFGHSMVMMHP